MAYTLLDFLLTGEVFAVLWKTAETYNKGNKEGESQSPSHQFICSRHHFLGFLLKHLKQERQRGWAKLLVLPCTDRQSEKG